MQSFFLKPSDKVAHGKAYKVVASSGKNSIPDVITKALGKDNISTEIPHSLENTNFEWVKTPVLVDNIKWNSC